MISVGEIGGRLFLRDDFTPTLVQAGKAVASATSNFTNLSKAAKGFGGATEEAAGSLDENARAFFGLADAASAAGGGMGGAATGIRDVGGASGGASGKVDDLGKSLMSAVVSGNLMSNAIQEWAGRLKGFVSSATETAARVEMLRGVSHFMGEQAGKTAAQIDEFAAKLNKQGITVQQSYDTLIQLSRANIDLSKSFDLAAVAQNSARIAGTNSSETLGRLIHGINTLQSDVLRTAGIIVNFELEQKKWSEQTGRNTSSMTAQEKQVMALNAVLEAGSRINGIYGKTNEFVAGRLQSLKRYQEDAAVAVGQVFIPALRASIDTMTEFYKIVRQQPEAFVAMGAGITILSAGLTGLAIIPKITAWIGGASTAMTFFTGSMAGAAGVIGGLAGATGLGLLAAGLAYLGARFNENAQAADGWKNRLIQAITAPLGVFNDMVDAFSFMAEKGAGMADVINLLQTASEKAGRPITNVNAAVKVLGDEMEIGGKKVKILADDFTDLRDKQDTIAEGFELALTQAEKFFDGIQKKGKQGDINLPFEFDPVLRGQLGAIQSSSITSNVNRDADKKYFEELGKVSSQALENIRAGMKAGTVGAKEYSEALQKAGIALSPETLERFNKTLDDQEKKTHKAKTAIERANEAIADATKAVGGMTEQQIVAVDMYHKMGVSNEHIAVKVGVSKVALESYLDVSKRMNEILRENTTTIYEVTAALEVHSKRMADAIISNALLVASAQKDLERFKAEQNMTPREKEIAGVNRDLNNSIAGLDKLDPSFGEKVKALQDAASAKIDAIIDADEVKQMVLFANGTTEAAKAVDELNKSTKAAAYEGLAGFFAQMGQIAGGGETGIGKFMTSMGTMVSGLGEANRATSQLNVKTGKELGGNFGQLSVLFNKNATGAQKLAAGLASAAGIAQGAKNIWDATGKSASKMQNALGGAMAGAQAGAMFGPWGVAIGAAAGLVVGLVRGKPAWAKAASEVGRDFGVKISDELAKTIAKNAKDLFKGSRQAASIFSLSDIIKEGGGLNEKNLSQMTGKLRDVFVMLQTGMFDSAQAMKVLEENWNEFAKAGTDATGALSEQLREILRLAQQNGVMTASMTAYLKEQASIVASMTNDIIGGSSSLFNDAKKLSTEIEDLQKQIDDLNKVPDRGRGADWAKDMKEAQDKLTEALKKQFDLAGKSKEELEDLGIIALGSFAAQMASGKSFAEALMASKDGLIALRNAYKDLGIDVEGAGIKMLLVQAGLVEKAPELVRGAEALGASITALANMGALTADSFGAMQRQGFRMFQKLEAQAKELGGTSTDALIPMQGFLHAAAKEAERLGIPLDENIQRMIDMSKEAGIWNDEMGRSETEQMTDAIKELTKAIEAMVRQMRGIPSDIPDPFSGWQPPPGGGTGPNPGSGTPTEGGSNAPLTVAAPDRSTGAMFVGGGMSSSRLAADAGTVFSAASMGVPSSPGGREVLVVSIKTDGRDPERVAEQVLRRFPEKAGRNEYGIRSAILQIMKDS
jgi:hypothetical protein